MKRMVIGMVTVIAVILLVLIGAVFAIGAALPVAHRANRTATLQASPEQVYAALAGSPDWHPGVARWSSEADPSLGSTWTEFDKNGRGVMYRQVETVPAHRLVTKIETKGLPYGGTWTYELLPAGTGTHLTITEDGEVYNPLFRFVSRFVMGHTATIDAYLAALRGKLGEKG